MKRVLNICIVLLALHIIFSMASFVAVRFRFFQELIFYRENKLVILLWDLFSFITEVIWIAPIILFFVAFKKRL
ncbi:MAG: hypothetical protein CMO78_05015 [Verrucomicrobiales bacterium]|nr:hypothetical protein [Verrucomicrobiales bacterium]